MNIEAPGYLISCADIIIYSLNPEPPEGGDGLNIHHPA
jgi:hypothetical protein